MPNPELQTELLDWNGCEWVESVQGRMHGTPVLVNTRMPADGVVENFDDGITVEQLVKDYGLDKQAVLGALQFAGRLKRIHAA